MTSCAWVTPNDRDLDHEAFLWDQDPKRVIHLLVFLSMHVSNAGSFRAHSGSGPHRMLTLPANRTPLDFVGAERERLHRAENSDRNGDRRPQITVIIGT